MALVVKNPSANAGDVRDSGSIPGLGRSPGGGHGNPLQYSCLENPTDRGAWWAIVHRVTKSWTRLQGFSTQHIVALQCLLAFSVQQSESTICVHISSLFLGHHRAPRSLQSAK